MTQVFSPTSNPTGRPPYATPPSSSPTAIVNTSAAPTLDDLELVGRMRELFQRARSERRSTVAQWVKNYRIMRNRTWMAGRLDYLPSPEVPECRSIIGSCVAWLTDQRPQFDLAAAAAPYSPYAEFFNGLAMDMSTALDAAWQTHLYEQRVEVAAWDAYQYDIGIFKTTWNPALVDGLGDVDIARIDPFTFYPDPQATCMEDSNYFIEARTISLQALDRRFPGSAAKFRESLFRENVDEMPNLRTGTGTPPRANPGAVAPATSPRYGLPGQSRDSISRDDAGVTLLECWLREHTYDKDSESIYECWRCVCVAGNQVLLNKRADELLPFSVHPYDVFVPESIGEFYGQSMVELLTPSQISINHILAAMQSNIDLTGMPIFKESSRSGLQRTKLTPRAGQRVTTAPGDTDSGWLTPPTLNAQMMELINLHLAAMERNSGLSAIGRAVQSSGRIASDVLDDVMEAGFVRIRLAQRNLEWCLRKVGQKAVAIIGEFYTEPRFLAITGPDGEKTARTLKARHFYVPTEEGAIPLMFQVQVRAGSMLPTSRNARIAEADALFAMGAIDRPVVLEAHDVPNRAAILSRIADAEAKGTFQPPGARQRARR